MWEGVWTCVVGGRSGVVGDDAAHDDSGESGREGEGGGEGLHPVGELSLFG